MKRKHTRKGEKAKIRAESDEAERRGEFRAFIASVLDDVYMRQKTIHDASEYITDVVYGDIKLKVGHKLWVTKVKIEGEESPSEEIMDLILKKFANQKNLTTARWYALMDYLDKQAGF